MGRILGSCIFGLLFLVSFLLVAGTPFLLLGFSVVVVGDEQLGNQPWYIQALIFLRPHLCLAFLWSLFILAVRGKWLSFGGRSGATG
jgi:hypothetical protein